MMNGHGTERRRSSRMSQLLGSPDAPRLTGVFVSSDSRTDRLMSARGQSTFQPPSAPPCCRCRRPCGRSGSCRPRPRASPAACSAGRPNCASTLAAASASVSTESTTMGRRLRLAMAGLPGISVAAPPREAPPRPATHYELRTTNHERILSESTRRAVCLCRRRSRAPTSSESTAGRLLRARTSRRRRCCGSSGP